MTSSQSSTVPFLEQFANSVILCSAKWYFGAHWGLWWKKKSSDYNWKEAFWETAFRCVNATHRVTRLSSVFSLLTQFSGNLQWDSSERNEASGDKGSILRWKLESRFVRNFLVMCEFISQSYTYVSCSSPLSVSLKNLRRTSLNRIVACRDKGNIISSNRERSFLRNFSALWIPLPELLLSSQEAVC